MVYSYEPVINQLLFTKPSPNSSQVALLFIPLCAGPARPAVASAALALPYLAQLAAQQAPGQVHSHGGQPEMDRL